MGRHTTEKTQELKAATRAFSDFGIQYVTTWTKKELAQFIDKPIVIPHGDYGFFVGNYEIIGLTKVCWRVKQKDGQVIGDFFNKAAAIVYCLCNIDQKYNKADEIYVIDSALGKLTNDILFYEKSMQVNQKNKNNTKHAILLNRYIDAKFKRKEYLNLLKKSLISAKYMKFGKLPL